MIQLVFAHAGYEFGSENGMPWKHISKDFQNFKMRTDGTTLVMGAKTFASLPGLLPKRKHIVVCDLDRIAPIAKNGDHAHQYISMKEFELLLSMNAVSDKTYSVIGGKDILQKAVHFAKVVYKTRIKMHPLEANQYVATQWLSYEFLDQIEYGFYLENSTLHTIDPTTSIKEEVYLNTAFG